MKWGIFIDAYLSQAARVGQRYVALVYRDQSGISEDGMTIATPPVRHVETRGGFKLMKSSAGDHYVITSEQGVGS